MAAATAMSMQRHAQQHRRAPATPETTADVHRICGTERLSSPSNAVFLREVAENRERAVAKAAVRVEKGAFLPEAQRNADREQAGLLSRLLTRPPSPPPPQAPESHLGYPAWYDEDAAFFEPFLSRAEAARRTDYLRKQKQG